MSKEYWEGPYYDYLMARMEEANSKNLKKSTLIKNDIKIPSDKTYELFVKKMKLIKGQKLIDIGCGFGRTFDYFFKHEVFVSGIDISSRMIEAAKKSYENEDLITELIVSSAEKLPFKDNQFDYLTSFGTFDCTNQELVLPEMLRVVKPGGLLCFSGKNYCYNFNDDKAYAAELGAKSKGHPNSFTFYEKMINQLIDNGHLIKEELFFVSRGDTTSLDIKKKNPGQFYEFTLYVINGNNPGDFSNLRSPTSYVFDAKKK